MGHVKTIYALVGLASVSRFVALHSSLVPVLPKHSSDGS